MFYCNQRNVFIWFLCFLIDFFELIAFGNKPDWWRVGFNIPFSLNISIKCFLSASLRIPSGMPSNPSNSFQSTSIHLSEVCIAMWSNLWPRSFPPMVLMNLGLCCFFLLVLLAICRKFLGVLRPNVFSESFILYNSFKNMGNGVTKKPNIPLIAVWNKLQQLEIFIGEGNLCSALIEA